MSKNVQIPTELFAELVKYHLLDDRSNEKKIIDGLEAKMQKISNHEIYTKSKTAKNEEDKEKARKEYLDRKGVPESFRW